VAELGYFFNQENQKNHVNHGSRQKKEIMNKKLGMIGAGNMGSAILEGIIKSKIINSDSIYIYDIDPDKTGGIKKKYNINIENDIISVFKKSDIIILAVKPQNMKEVLSIIAGNGIAKNNEYKNYIKKQKVIVSIAAGISIKSFESILHADIEENLKANISIIRVMPNTPALVLSGISAITANSYAKKEDVKNICSIMSTIGEVVEIEEKDMDAVSAISGCGPAYLFYLVESMTEAGIKLEIDPIQAFKLSLGAVKGAAALLEKTGESPEALRKKVTSPGGMTEAAFKVFEAYGVKENIIEAINSAKKRGTNLGKKVYN
jgi:pyrroline-5-carboxylate reductase